MLDFYFKYPRVLRRLRDGALGNEMDRIAAHFFDLGYDPASAKIYISRLAKFSEFAARGAGRIGGRSCDLVFFCTSICEIRIPGPLAETGTKPDSAPQTPLKTAFSSSAATILLKAASGVPTRFTPRTNCSRPSG